VVAQVSLKKGIRMRVAVDITSCLKARLSGIGVYIRSLLYNLSELDHNSTYDFWYRLSKHRRRQHLPEISRPNIRYRYGFPLLERFAASRADVYHGPDARLPVFDGPALVVTIHDVFSIISDKFAPRTFVRKKQKYYRDCIKRASAIIVPSEATKNDLLCYLSAESSRIHVIPMAGHSEVKEVSENIIKAVHNKYNIVKPYVLCVGPISVRKNTANVVRAFASIKSELNSDTQLVVIGRLFQPEDMFEALKEAGCSDFMINIQDVSTEELSAFYCGARVLAFPSLNEGFGIPILEAMGLGVPVVTSNISSMPEVAGNAAILVDPKDTKALGTALLSACEDETKRERMIRNGYLQAKKFSWHRTAAETLKLYRILSGASPKTGKE
jgi:glycosyltransferase involved in cell wall biosynthesis